MPSGSRSSEQAAAYRRAAANLADSFANTENLSSGSQVMSHLARAALESGERVFQFDLLGDEAGPTDLVTPAVFEAVAHYRRWFPRCIGYEAIPPRRVSHATLRVEFDFDGIREPRSWEPEGPRIVPFCCEAVIVDSEGQSHPAREEGTVAVMHAAPVRPRRFWWQFWRAGV